MDVWAGEPTREGSVGDVQCADGSGAQERTRTFPAGRTAVGFLKLSILKYPQKYPQKGCVTTMCEYLNGSQPSIDDVAAPRCTDVLYLSL